MYTTSPGLILGFHGCDQSIAHKVLNGSDSLRSSENEYDWLGHGVYFWENSNSRALEFAQYLKDHPRESKSSIKKPTALGAVISLGYCLDLLDYNNLQLLKSSFETFRATHQLSDFPVNKKKGELKELKLRNLDCAVIEFLHNTMSAKGGAGFDSVRGVFFEGNELYPGSGFNEKDHIQICIRNSNCIKGYFLPRALSNKYPKV